MQAVHLFLVACLLQCVVQAQTAAAYKARADQATRENNPQAALAAVLNEEKLEKPSAELQDRVGFLLAVLGRNDEAIARFDRAIALNPGYSLVRYHMGALCLVRGDRDRGIRELQRAVQLEPDNFDYHFQLGNAYLENAQYDEAASELTTATGLNANQAKAWDALGHAQQRKGDLAAALKAYTHALDIDPKNDIISQ